MPTTTARKELLDRVHDLMSSYLGEECPDDENWEDFDPDIDQLRTEAGNLLNEEINHIAQMPTEPSRFVVEIAFLSEGEPFASETHIVEAIDWPSAKCVAFRRSDDSVYSDDRIPDLTRRAIDRSTRDPSAPR